MTEAMKTETLDEFESFYQKNVTPEEVAKGYEAWASNGSYDNDFEAIVHRGHLMIADLLEEFYRENRDEVYIIDIAAGTGRVGQELRKRGFTKVDALDPCEPMLKVAEEKNVYNRLILARVGGEPLDIPEGTYDAVSCCAAFVEGHLPAEAIQELLRIVKKGGIIAMVGNAEYWDTIPEYRERMEGIIQNLEREKKLKTAKREIKDGFIGSKYKAVSFVLQKL